MSPVRVIRSLRLIVIEIHLFINGEYYAMFGVYIAKLVAQQFREKKPVKAKMK